jgi:hypothetical protein
MGIRTNEDGLAYWRRHVDQYEASGQTRASYSSAQGIKVHTLDYWRWKLKRQPAARRSGWIPVKVIEETSSIDLSIGKVCITVRRGFDRELLGEVLQVLSA